MGAVRPPPPAPFSLLPTDTPHSYYGGWAAPNIYYLGASSILNFRGLRIGGLSGIYNARDYLRLHHERLPYSFADVKSVYHVRAYDTFKLHQAREPVDVMVSHDWPSGIEFNGDLDTLLRTKPWFKSDIESGDLGSPPARSLLYKLRPRYWFSAHMHVKFAAVVDHEDGRGGGGGETGVQTGPKEGRKGPQEGRKGADIQVEAVPEVKNPDELEIELDMDMDESEGGVVVNSAESEDPGNTDEIDLDLETTPATPPPGNTGEIDLDLEVEATPVSPPPPTASAPDAKNRYTHFLALDKCLPRRDFLQLLEITPSPGASLPHTTNTSGLAYDPEWLSITRALNPYLHLPNSALQRASAGIAAEIERQREWVDVNIVRAGKLDVPDDFAITAPVHAEVPQAVWSKGPSAWQSPQTARFCALVGIEDGTFESEEEKERRLVKRKEKEERAGGEGQGESWRGRGGGRGGGGGGGGGRGNGRGRGSGSGGGGGGGHRRGGRGG